MHYSRNGLAFLWFLVPPYYFIFDRFATCFLAFSCSLLKKKFLPTRLVFDFFSIFSSFFCSKLHFLQFATNLPPAYYLRNGPAFSLIACSTFFFFPSSFFHFSAVLQTPFCTTGTLFYHTTTPGLYILHCGITRHAPPAQLSPAIYSSAAQHSAAPCGAVRCRASTRGAVWCCFVLRCAFVRPYSGTRYDAEYQVPGTRYHRYVRVVYFRHIFAFFSWLCSVGPHAPPPPLRKLHPYCR